MKNERTCNCQNLVEFSTAPDYFDNTRRITVRPCDVRRVVSETKHYPCSIVMSDGETVEVQARYETVIAKLGWADMENK